ncbi:speedy protein A isoform X3 [Tympanuchus pallidicinctus]|uniref:speedy protein A isoform X3 n=1 Tax=Tympanuchus pallidicinctus TaxID=109042 RepID=UPI002286DB9E|nr:speedy protein A isoform X3 [Tympanuchus pallidicinctus]
MMLLALVSLIGPWLATMWHSLVRDTPPAAHLKPNAIRAPQQKKVVRPNRRSSRKRLGNCEKRVRNGTCGQLKPPGLVIQRQEMTAFFKLFDDDLIQDFLWMDSCCKIADKVMAIAPTHYIWQRERSVYHSGAIRNYNKDKILLPRGPNNSPIPCYVCGNKGRFVRLGLSSSSSSASSLEELCSSQDSKDTFAIEKMLVDSPASAQDCQSLSSKRRRDNTWNQDNSMDWFTMNEE